MCIYCEEKRVRIRRAQRVSNLLSIAKGHLTGMDRDLLGDHRSSSFLLREAALLVAEADLDMSMAQEQATRRIEEALQLCDSCGKWRGSHHYGDHRICVVCFLAYGQSAIDRLEHAERLNQQVVVA